MLNEMQNSGPWAGVETASHSFRGHELATALLRLLVYEKLRVQKSGQGRVILNRCWIEIVRNLRNYVNQRLIAETMRDASFRRADRPTEQMNYDGDIVI